MIICRKIISYAKRNYTLTNNLGIYDYKDHSDVFLDCMRIYKYGDIPSVRRACDLYNNSPYKTEHINPSMSEDIQKEMTDLKRMKQELMCSLKVKKGKFLVDFPD